MPQEPTGNVWRDPRDFDLPLGQGREANPQNVSVTEGAAVKKYGPAVGPTPKELAQTAKEAAKADRVAVAAVVADSARPADAVDRPGTATGFIKEVGQAPAVAARVDDGTEATTLEIRRLHKLAESNPNKTEAATATRALKAIAQAEYQRAEGARPKVAALLRAYGVRKGG